MGWVAQRALLLRHDIERAGLRLRGRHRMRRAVHAHRVELALAQEVLGRTP